MAIGFMLNFGKDVVWTILENIIQDQAQHMEMTMHFIGIISLAVCIVVVTTIK
jgi:hypothetical protein